MGIRGWRRERVLRVADPNGKQVEVVVGLVRSNEDGRWRRGLAIGNGPSALFNRREVNALIVALEQSKQDLDRVEGGR
jgi:hypothetical protein